MPGLGASFGRGAATDYPADLANADCILIMGSNMAEAHPVAFRWPMKARERGATLIHVDPHFSRTRACSNMYVNIRAGSDIAFLGGLINYVLTHEKWFKEYVLAYTNASTIIQEGFEDTEDLGGIFSGYDKEKRAYEAGKGRWNYEGSEAAKIHGHDDRGCVRIRTEHLRKNAHKERRRRLVRPLIQRCERKRVLSPPHHSSMIPWPLASTGSELAIKTQPSTR